MNVTPATARCTQTRNCCVGATWQQCKRSAVWCYTAALLVQHVHKWQGCTVLLAALLA
jgi:hypothetical protein